jgi:hypothetical protein
MIRAAILTPTLLFLPSSAPAHLRTILLPLSDKEPQPKIIRLESYLTPLWKEKHVTLLRLDFFTRFVADVEVAIYYDLDLIVRIRVYEWRSLFEAVETATDGFIGVCGLSGGEGLVSCSWWVDGVGGG